MSDNIDVNYDSKKKVAETILNNMIEVQAGEFLMGQPQIRYKYFPNGFLGCYGYGPALIPWNNNSIQHKVILTNNFYLSKYLLTVEQAEIILNNRLHCFATKRKSFCCKNAIDQLPATNINWIEANEICETLNKLTAYIRPKNYIFAIPSEAQWEFACRANTTTDLSNGIDIVNEYDERASEVCWYEVNSNNQMQPIGQKSPNSWGFFDMHGNVYEWCADMYNEQHKTSDVIVDPLSENNRNYSAVIRGGSFRSPIDDCYSDVRSKAYLGGKKCKVLKFWIAL